MLFRQFLFEKLMYPGYLLLIPGVLALGIAEYMAQPPSTLRISSSTFFTQIPKGKRIKLLFIPPVLRTMGLILLIVAFARPLGELRPYLLEKDAIDIMLCVDVSGSMRAIDFFENNVPRDRLYVTKLAVKDFINSRKFRPEDRYGLDRIGLILYAGYAWTQCPLTFDYFILQQELERANIDFQNPSKDGTAIGSAIGLAVSRLANSQAKTKIIILLTDGRNNRGEIDPITASQFAKDKNIKIYTIGAGSKEEVFVPINTPFGERYRKYLIPIDEELLKKIAETTGGQYYNASDLEKLKAAYTEIDKLEKTTIKSDVFYDYEEKFLGWAISGLLLTMTAVFSKRMWFEPIP